MIETLMLRPAEAAVLCGVSRSNLYQMAQAGELVGVVRLGGSVRIHRPTLEAWLAEIAGKGLEPSR
jgi:excisionase family DNA binding protein